MSPERMWAKYSPCNRNGQQERAWEWKMGLCKPLAIEMGSGEPKNECGLIKAPARGMDSCAFDDGRRIFVSLLRVEVGSDEPQDECGLIETRTLENGLTGTFVHGVETLICILK